MKKKKKEIVTVMCAICAIDIKPEKKFESLTGFELVTIALPLQIALTVELSSSEVQDIQRIISCCH